jgi:hypothetical protein
MLIIAVAARLRYTLQKIPLTTHDPQTGYAREDS